jgi:hypothetical protein
MTTARKLIEQVNNHLSKLSKTSQINIWLTKQMNHLSKMKDAELSDDEVFSFIDEWVVGALAKELQKKGLQNQVAYIAIQRLLKRESTNSSTATMMAAVAGGGAGTAGTPQTNTSEEATETVTTPSSLSHEASTSAASSAAGIELPRIRHK